MRYYCYYCWVSETYARSGASDDFEAWRTWLRKAEALYALVAAYAEETGVGGTEWANVRLAVDKKVIDFAAAASTDRSQKLYLRQALGVLGGVYFSQMAEIGRAHVLTPVTNANLGCRHPPEKKNTTL